MSAESYLSRGVSPTKDDVKKAVAGQSAGVFPGAFCKLNDDIAGDPDYVCAIHADGAGTKSSVAYLRYMETGDPRSFFSLAQDSLVMNIDDLSCVGATGGFILSNTIGRNAHRVDGACIAQIIKGYDHMIDLLSEYGVDVVMAGGETADVGDLVRTVIIDSTVVVRLQKDQVICAANIKPGDVIIGLSSTGKAVYEQKENSGISSNGLTAARHMLLSKHYYERYPESLSETVPSDKAYCGKYLLTDQLPDTCFTVAEAILSPTRTYLPILAQILPNMREQISGIIHCTGGGLVKCRDFGKDIRYVKDNLFELPAVFSEIYKSGEIPEQELYQVFNCGHRLEIYCDKEAVGSIVSASEKLGVEARVIGRVEISSEKGRNEVVIHGSNGVYNY
ncbi:MAG: AIR synthase-related protein [Oscillospiraceae bacterium]|jgi:phosphoribosylformylglycinamidine cyclo-ligase|nr:AIR synthase-related protein [Oscillospiraceae bacterium]